MSESLDPSPSALTPGAARVRPTVKELLSASLLLGSIGFGGGISVLSNIRRLGVEQRRWVTEEEFNQAATVAQMLPGGAAANALACLGLRFHGPWGAFVCYAGFVAPGMLAVLALAWVYVRFGATPHAEALLSGVNAVVVGIVAAITLRMVKGAIARMWQMAVAASALFLSLAGGSSSGEVALLGISTGLLIHLGRDRARKEPSQRPPRKEEPPVASPEDGRLWKERDEKPSRVSRLSPFTVPLALLLAAGMRWESSLRELLQVAAVFFRTGLGAYGGGFAIIPHLQTAMISHAWLTARQFADAVAIGKLTPGPVLLMATFIGYVRSGLLGALVATFSIFAAPFVLVLVLAGWLERARSNPLVEAGLRGLTPAVVGLMAAAGLTLGSSLQGGVELAIAASVTLAMTRFELNPAAMLLCGGAIRVVLRFLVQV